MRMLKQIPVYYGHTRKWAKRSERTLLIIAASTALTCLLVNLDFNLLEANLYDIRMSHGLARSPDSNIVLVTIDDATFKALDDFEPLPLDVHVRFLEAISHFKPKAVGYLVDLNDVNQVNPDLLKQGWGTGFVDAAHNLENNGTVFLIGTNYDVTGEVLPPFPISSLPHSVALLHKDGNVFGEDKVTRRALLTLDGKPTFQAHLAQRLGLIRNTEAIRGIFEVPEAGETLFFFRYHGNTALKLKSPMTYPRYSFLDILQGKLDTDTFKDKIVLVSTLSKENSADFAYTPFSKVSFLNPKIVVHANILDSVIHNDGIDRIPNIINWAATFVTTLFVFGWILSSTPLSGVFAVLSFGIVFLLIGHVLFQLEGIWIRESQPLVGLFVAYYLGVPYRLIREYKKRWDYQKKNEVLTQVEKLKTNFMSLVTHDLKTPVARIQGLAEVLIRRSSARMSESDLESLQHIVDSTEELNRFISSILELSRIESSRLYLKIESKDINQLIEKLVENFKPQVRAKKIRISTQLDPLFPIKMDPSLISKVINNIIDNAIKYSPSGSEVQIESKENGPWVEIAIRDQGIGMSEDERKNLFTRFYRAKNDATTRTPGTGLGLYLTKFFVEAHGGRVEVESELGKGSVFKIFLLAEGTPSEQIQALRVGTGPGLSRLLAKAIAKKSISNDNALSSTSVDERAQHAVEGE